MAVLDLEKLVKDYGQVRAIHGVDLTIDNGEFCVFVGPSGCGKSTLLRMIAGLEDITGGELRIDGQRVNEQRASERGLAMVFQTYALYPHMTVRQNLAFGLENIRTPKPEIERRVAEAARMLQIEAYLDRRPKQLSGGQRQRVAIGRAVVREPRVFLFDEPLSNLDAELRVTMRGEISALHRRLGNTMIYVTHDQVEAMTMADKIVVLRDGRIEQAGSPLDLYNTPRNSFVAGFIGSPRMNFIDVTVTAIDAEGVALKDAAGNAYRAAVSGEGLTPGQAAELGIRPDHLEIGDVDGTAVTVQSVEQLGGESYLYCEAADGTKLTAHLPGQTAIRRGETACLVLRPQFTHLFAKEGGLAQRRLVIGEAV
ncbi:ABC transporter ATP-binding protein [Aquibium microcysteis]|uniref:ABC transporter ATP-binding protein n=1 Tax=Aquibium microcysteis TaxID=675281 RepID=UPI00165D1069|nr:sn-glycerol-3-phosphate ABC transporter ATP-binding protein UgpC [Aquibium microcysteis]